MRSFTLSMFPSVILSPTATSARAAGASIAAVTASAAVSLRVLVIARPSLDDPRPCLGSESEASVSRSVDRAPAIPPPAKTRVAQRGHAEPGRGDARLLTLVEVPALLAREARARERRFGRVLELHVDHDDRRDEAHLVRVFDRGGALEGLLLEAHVVEPYLPQ